jgi:hypothetical protein
MKLKIYVNLQETDEDKMEDPNLDLVKRGFFPMPANYSGHLSSENNATFIMVQTVVVYDMVSPPENAQLAFLKHLKSNGVIERYALYDDADKLTQEY